MSTYQFGGRAAVSRSTSSEHVARWEDSAACLTVPATVFDAKDVAGVAKAKKVCGRCPVRQMCLDWALDTQQDVGVLGGLSEAERRRVHKRCSRPDTGPVDGLKSRTEQLLADPQAYRDLVAQGMKPADIARELNTNVGTLNQVAARLAEREAEQEGLLGVMAK